MKGANKVDNFLSVIMPAILFAGTIAFVLIKAVRKNKQREKNALCSVLTVRARVKSRRLIIRPNNITALGVATDTLEGKVVFESEDGEELEFRLIGKTYRDIIEGDEGMLTYQGTDFISFDRSGRNFVYGEQ